MFKYLKNSFNIHPFIVFCFILCSLYWGYLILTTQMTSVFDAAGYELSGQSIVEHGWGFILKKGPDREPLYLFIISLSMHLAKILPLSYQTVLKVFNFFSLFLTQVLCIKILRKLRINDYLIGFTILYLGFSPSLTNSALRLWSEIGSYPFPLLIVWFGHKAWISFSARRFRSMLLTSIGLGLSLLLATSIKGVFEIASLFFLIPFLYFPAKALQGKNKIFLKQSLLALSIAFMCFYGPLTGYKLLNKIYNGYYTLTGRGAWALYGNSVRRMEKLTFEDYMADLAMSVDASVCQKIYAPEKCFRWTARHSDDISDAKTKEFRAQNIPAIEHDALFLKLSVQEILKNPFQFASLVLIESIKGLFWEGRTGFVVYPDWLDKVYWPLSAKYPLRWTMAGVTLTGLVFGFIYIVSGWKRIFSLSDNPAEEPIIIFSTLLVIIPVLELYSIFFILYRYIFTIVPLYLILFAFFTQRTGLFISTLLTKK